MSPARSITARARRRPHAGLKAVVAIVVSFQAQRQLDGVVALVAADVHRVDHACGSGRGPSRAASARPRASPRGRARARRGSARAPPWSVICTRSRGRSTVTLDVHRQLGVVAVAVLHRVHRRLADRGLQALEPRRREPERRDRLGRRGASPRARCPGSLASANSASCDVAVGAAAERDQRDVVLLLGVGAGELAAASRAAGRSARSPRRRATRRARSGAGSRTSRARRRAPRRGRRCRAAAARRARAPSRSPRRACPASGRAACPVARSSSTAAAAATYGRSWPALAKRSWPVAGSSTPYRQVTNIFSGMSGQRCSLTRSSTSPGLDQPLGGGAQHARVAAITSAAGTPLSVTSPITRPTRAVGQRDEVVEVAADLARRPVVGGDLPARQVGQRAGQEVLLDQPGDLQLLLEALAAADLGLLLAHELADAHRRRRLRGEALEQLAVVAGVLLLGQPRAEVEHPDQLALGDERHDELARRPRAARAARASRARARRCRRRRRALWK